ncbi:membrane protein [Alphaproteobacteria bacterium]|nr:membrane protein [Alphaproteobacteria bacterium]
MDQQAQESRAAFRRVNVAATLLLAVMAGIAFLSAWRQDLHPAMGHIRAFAEAAMIGGLADWFAVTALFRRPLGLPIPHTAIILKGQKRIARGTGDFVAANFFNRKAILRRLEGADPVRRLAEWLSIEENAQHVAAKIIPQVPIVMDAFGEEPIRRLFGDLVMHRLSGIDAGLLSANMLDAAIKDGRHLASLNFISDRVEVFIKENKSLIHKVVADKSKWWVPGWVTKKLASEISQGLEQTFSEMRDDSRPWKETFHRALTEFSGKLRSDPDLRVRVEEVKNSILSNPEIAAFLATLSARFALDLRRFAADGRLEAAISAGLLELARRLQEDERLRKFADLQLIRLASGAIPPSSRMVGDFAASVIEKWDGPTLVQKVEAQLGRDLQYIRISGALVGGLVGLVLHAIGTI